MTCNCQYKDLILITDSMKHYNNEKYIVSFTTFPQRYNDACKMIYSILQKQTYKNFHLVMTLYKGDVAKITPTLQLFIDNDLLELIVAEENLCPHLKYFYAMKKYWDKPIITIDDDRIYSPNTLQKLISKYESLNYKTVVSNCAISYGKHGNIVTDRNTWPRHRLKPNEKSFVAMAEGFAGVLYPPKCYANLDAELPYIKQCLFDDDLYLQVMRVKNKIPVTQSNSTYGAAGENGTVGQDIQHAQNFSLAKHNNAPMRYRADVTRKFNNELLKGFDL